MFTLLLAGSRTEAAEYIGDKGMRVAHVKYAASAEAIRGLRPSRILQLPSFEKRSDRHAVMASVRPMLAQRGLEVEIEHDEAWVRPADRPVPPAPAGLDQIPGQVSIEEAISAAETDLLQRMSTNVDNAEVSTNVDNSNALETKEPEPKPAAKPKRKAPAKKAPAKTPAKQATADFWGQ